MLQCPIGSVVTVLVVVCVMWLPCFVGSKVFYGAFLFLVPLSAFGYGNGWQWQAVYVDRRRIAEALRQAVPVTGFPLPPPLRARGGT